MARVEFAPEIIEDLDRILAHLTQYAPTEAPLRIAGILHAIDALTHNPLIGRLAPNGNRELVIGRKSHGYIALYQYLDEIDTVFVLAVRSQRETGYRR